MEAEDCSVNRGATGKPYRTPCSSQLFHGESSADLPRQACHDVQSGMSLRKFGVKSRSVIFDVNDALIASIAQADLDGSSVAAVHTVFHGVDQQFVENQRQRHCRIVG